jgi:hypothetical protein
MADIVEKFVNDIKEACGENLKSVILYGSRASSEYIEKRSDYNTMLILGSVEFKDLQTLSNTLKGWIKKGNQPPQIFSGQMFQRSADVFPIEFLDIKDNHKVLFGEDPFNDLQITEKNLRHECEFELKGKLLKLRQGYLNARGSSSKVRELLVLSLSSFLTVIRHSARLYGQVPSAKKLEAVEKLSEKIGFDPAVFSTVQKIKAGDREALKRDPETVMEDYMKQIEKIIESVDSL